MTEAFEHKGFWFLPEHDTTKVAGMIIFDPYKGLILDLFGVLSRKNRSNEFILGELENGVLVTLYNNFEIQRRMNLPGFPTSKYASNYMFKGAHFIKKKDILFNKVSAHYSYLDEWLSINSGFKKIETNPKDYKITIEYELPEPIHVDLNSNTKLTVNLTSAPPYRKAIQKDVSIKQKSFIQFGYKNKTRFDTVLKDTFHFQNFLTLCLQRAAYHKELNGFIKVKGEKELQKIEIYFLLYQYTEEKQNVHMTDFLINYRQIAWKFSDIICRWFQNRKEMEPVCDPFFSTYYNSNLYTSDKFLSLFRSIEAFYRDIIKIKANNKGKLLGVLTKYSPVFNSILKIPSKEKFVTKLLKYRNDFTHSNPVLKDKDKRYMDLHYLSEKIQIIMSCALLCEHCLTEQEVKESLDKTRLFVHIKYKLN